MMETKMILNKKHVFKPLTLFLMMALPLLVQCVSSNVNIEQQTQPKADVSAHVSNNSPQNVVSTLSVHSTPVSTYTPSPIVPMTTWQYEEFSYSTVTSSSNFSLIDWSKDNPHAVLVLTSSQFSLSNGGLNRSLVIIRPDGVQQWLNESNSDVYQPALSPGCDQVAFIRSYGVKDGLELSNLALLDLTNNSIVELTTLAGEESSPTWSPSGEQIAFSYFDGQSSQIYIYSLETQEPLQLTKDGWAQWPDWSPDGSQILFSLRDGNSYHPTIYTIDVVGNNQGALIGTYWGSGTFEDPERYGSIDPAWSPDGHRIAFTTRESIGFPEREVSKIYVMGSDGSDIQRLTRGDPHNEDPNDPDFYYVSEGEPVWSPDGRQIFYTRYTEPTELCVADVSSGKTHCTPSSNGNSWGFADWCYLPQ